MRDDFSELEKMTYSGRGIIIGMTPEGRSFIGYTLTGRSPSSQARSLEYNATLKSINIGITDEKILRTGNPSLLVYSAIEFIDDENARIIASNGKQTDIIRQYAYEDASLSPLKLLDRVHASPVSIDGIDVTTYEPDAPNSTPRISGCVGHNEGAFYLVKKMPDSDKPIRLPFPYLLRAGEAQIITTYHGNNDNPLSSFNYPRPLSASIASNNVVEICENLYEAIGPKDGQNYRVAAAVMMLVGKRSFQTTTINRADLGY